MKKFLAIVLAIITGFVAFKILSGLISVLWSILTSVAVLLVVGGIAYLAYRKFNHMLSSGKRLT